MTTATVNGEISELTELQGTLINFLREQMGLTGAKPGCGEGQCGACTVLVDGEPAYSCQLQLSEVAGHSITTIEGLACGDRLHPLQEALVEEMASQCGYCTPAMAMRGAALLERCPEPDAERIAAALGPNLCRCGCYGRIARAVNRASRLSRAGADQVTASQEATETETTETETTEAGETEAEATEAEVAGGRFRPRRPWDLCEPEEREWSALLGDGLVVVWPPPPPVNGWPMGGGAWLHVSPSGLVTAFSGKVNVGQDNTSAFRLLVAEELGANLDDVRIVQGDTDVCPFDMGTVGSRSMPDAGEALRRAAAGTRRALEALVPTGSAPVDGIRLVVLTDEPVLKAPMARQFVGRPAEFAQKAWRASRVEVVTGRRRFVSDMELPGLVYGSVLRPPVQGATLLVARGADAERVRGVTFVREGNFVGVTAPDRATARRALDDVEATWDLPSAAGPDMVSYLRSHPKTDTGWERAVDESYGDVENALATATKRVDATYTTSYIAHVPLETRAALASWADGRLTTWTGTQRPFNVRRYLADELGMDEADVRVIVPPTGGGFGGKHTGDVALEAARLSRAVGRPVKVHWSRGEEFQAGYLRPAAVIDVRAGLDDAGSISAWDFLDFNAGPAALGMPYSVANRRLRYQPVGSPLAQGSYRALGANANNFARECHIDELAHEAGADPVVFRLHRLDDDRLATVLRVAAENFCWPERRQRESMGHGVAVGLEKGGRVATCAEVCVEQDGVVRVTRIVTAYECGALVNPDTVVNQVEGATVMALGGALWEAVPWDDGRRGPLSLSNYRVPRFGDLPRIDVVLVDRPDLPSAGAGETPMIAVAPAVANAIFAATGSRLRSLPLVPAGLPVAPEGAPVLA
ncbi:MAG TPA: molybdopterin cofactor-binding domain-containing protein [Acidimicrobiales bacterium]|nr:molybdopterin cofactor-binding domain-containing protein [Acidimicrobiales bacterium]